MSYTDGCEECEDIKAFCTECWFELPADIRKAEMDRLRIKKLKAKRAREELKLKEGTQ
jgi:hypothetical protein